jgi:molybdate transport system substrate-binding protein
MPSSFCRAFSKALVALVFTGITTTLHAAEITVMISGGFFAAYKSLAPRFEQSSGHVLKTVYGPSMGKAPEAIANRLARGEPADVVIMAAPALDQLIVKGVIAAEGRTDLAVSAIGMAVRAGAPQPDIATVDAFRRTLLAAKTIAYSDSASGVYLSTVLFKELGIDSAMQGRRRGAQGEAAGAVVARGEAELAFQQISELLPIAGIEIVGALPDAIQQLTVFAAGIPVQGNSSAAQELIRFLASPAAAEAIRASGLAPAVQTSTRGYPK